QDLEKLHSEYPKEPSILEKLAYAYSKEIMTRDRQINLDAANKAVAGYEALIQIDPTRMAAMNNLANVYFTIGKTDEAISMWEKAVQTNPKFLDAHLNLG